MRFGIIQIRKYKQGKTKVKKKFLEQIALEKKIEQFRKREALEIKNIEKVFKNPRKPVLAIIGGSKLVLEDHRQR